MAVAQRDRNRRFRALRALAAVMAVVVIGATLAVVVGRTLLPGVVHDAAATVGYGVDLPPLPPLAQRSVILDRDGGVMATLFSDQNREPVKLTDVSPALVDAVLAAEDRTFFQHHGVNWRSTMRALAANVQAGGVEQGGSTITQQLVKNTYFDIAQADSRTMARKVREALLAMQLEKRLTKRQILERYLNTVYFGNGAYGIRAAAERYFATEPRRLTISQSALLAALIASPGGRDPVAHPTVAQAARSRVVAAMLTMGRITAPQAATANRAPLPQRVHAPARVVAGNYFTQEVVRQLLADKRLGATEQERSQRLYTGGLRIETTFDPRLQALAETAVRRQLPPGTQFTAALVSVDNRDGAVRAVVGGPGTERLEYDLALQGRRQAGSTFKAITLAAALQMGYAPDDRVSATAPCTFEFDPKAPPWVVRNFEAGEGGTVTLRDAIARSLNCAFARLVVAIGPQRVVDMARRLGVRSPLDPVPSITLGTQGVSPLDMATAFSTLAADGEYREPYFVRRAVASDGTVLIEHRDRARQVLDPQVARTTTDMLRGVVTDGTGTAADIGRPVAGKTGTNEEWRDAWFVGYAPELTTAVWMGDPRAQVPMIDVGGINVTGGSYPARIWAALMGPALAGTPVVDFVAPDPTRWPRPRWFDERGRTPTLPRGTPSDSSASRAASPDAAPGRSPGGPPTTAPVTAPGPSPGVPPTTRPAPVTAPPPATTPPTTAPPPPNTVPPATTGPPTTGGPGG